MFNFLKIVIFLIKLNHACLIKKQNGFKYQQIKLYKLVKTSM